MKKIFCFMAALILSTIAFAQGFDLQGICSKLAVNPITKGNFVQVKTINSSKGARELKSNGDFIFSLDGIMWKTLKPFPSSMIVGKDFLVQVAADGTKTVTDTSNNPAFASVAETITSIFSNDYARLTSSFDSSISNEDSLYSVVLTPKDSTIASVLSNIELKILIDSTVTITSVIMTESSGNKTTYLFSNHSYPKELTQDEKDFFVSK